jgi:hypothetical protein
MRRWISFLRNPDFRIRRTFPNQEIKGMKRLLVIALGLGIALGTVSFAQDTTDTSKKMTKKKKKKGTDTSTPPAAK